MYNNFLNLDYSQINAVNAKRGPLAISAGAGSGKTRTLIARVLNHIENHKISPGNILIITYTNRAVSELKDRMSFYDKEYTNLNLSTLNISTFHSAAYKQIKYFWYKHFPELEWQFINSKINILNRITNFNHTYLDFDELKDISTEISWAKSNLISPENYLEVAKINNRQVDLDLEQVYDFYKNYEEKKIINKKTYLLDFEDLIIYANLIISNSEKIKEIYSNQYTSFFVDEFQDISPSQFSLLNTWLNNGSDLTVVGDANQTIFTFSGANNDYLENFANYFKDADKIKLKYNYRSDSNIVHKANKLLNKEDKQLPVKESVNKVVLKNYMTDLEQNTFILKEIDSLIKNRVNLNKIAILFRFNYQSTKFEFLLKDKNIPFKLNDINTFFSSNLAKNIIRQLKLEYKNSNLLNSHIVNKVFENNGLTNMKPKGMNKLKNWQNLYSFKNIIVKKLEIEKNTIKNIDFLDEIISFENAALDSVTLSTFHGAKGKEWDYVFLVDLNDGIIPTWQSINKNENLIYEEKNLFYVGMTRAKTKLYLLSFELNNESGKKFNRSRFLSII